MRRSIFSPQTTLRAHLRQLFTNIAHPPHPARRRFLTLHDPQILPLRIGPRSPPTPNTTLLTRRLRATYKPNHVPRRPNSTSNRPSPDPTPHLGSPVEDVNTGSLSQRLRKLSREYGWSALGIYLALSALDFPFCFLAVRALGTERIGHWEHVIVGALWRVLSLDGRLGSTAQGAEDGGAGVTGEGVQTEESSKRVGERVEGGRAVTAVAVRGGQVIEEESQGQGWDWGVEEADEANQKSDATIWTQLALAYAIHKSFIFLRVPATVAVTPKVVRVLRGWGWDIGKRKPKTSGGFKASQTKTGKGTSSEGAD